MLEAGDVRVSRAWVLGVGLMLVLTTVPTSAQAAMMAGDGGPCVWITSSGGVGVGECNHGGGGSGGSGGSTSSSDEYPLSSGSGAFPSTDATVVGQDTRVMWTVGDDVRVSWTFDEGEVEANVTAFHVQRGLDPTVPGSMRHVASAGPTADTYHDENAVTSGDLWYVVTADLANGDLVHSQPFRVNGLYT